jgi:hypothetical protein
MSAAQEARTRLPLKDVSNNAGAPDNRLLHKSVAALRTGTHGKAVAQVNKGKVMLAQSPVGAKNQGSKLQADRSPMQGKTPTDMKRVMKKKSTCDESEGAMATLSMSKLTIESSSNTPEDRTSGSQTPSISFKLFPGKISPFTNMEVNTSPATASDQLTTPTAPPPQQSPSKLDIKRFALLSLSPSEESASVSALCSSFHSQQHLAASSSAAAAVSFAEACIAPSTTGYSIPFDPTTRQPTDPDAVERARKGEEAKAKREAARARKLAALAEAEAAARRREEAAAAARARADAAMEEAAGGAAAVAYEAVAAERTAAFELFFACRHAGGGER